MREITPATLQSLSLSYTHTLSLSFNVWMHVFFDAQMLINVNNIYLEKIRVFYLETLTSMRTTYFLYCWYKKANATQNIY